jgi:hypothetical protein
VVNEINIPSGINYADAIQALVLRALPGQPCSFRMKPTDRAIHAALVYGLHVDSEPWLDAEELAQSIGMRLRRRGDTVTAYVPFGQRLANARWRFISEPIKRARLRAHERLNPPVEYPDPDYGDWEDTND